MRTDDTAPAGSPFIAVIGLATPVTRAVVRVVETFVDDFDESLPDSYSDDGAGNDMSDEQWEINRVTAEGEVIGTIEPFKWTKGSELSWKHDPRVPSIYEDGYESPSNGAAETDPNWPFPSGKTP